jgi:hypothetical protein
LKKIKLSIVLLFLNIFLNPIRAQGSELDFSDIEELRKSATEESNSKVTALPADEANDEAFVNRGLGLQKLNPELSITGDFLAGFSDSKTLNGGKSDFLFRGLGLHFESYLDPYTRLKAAVPISEEGAELGEAYITSFGFAKSLSLTLGKFRQNFGVINRWHKHALDQTDFPLALRKIYGDGGLNQSGVSLDWNFPASGKAVEKLSLQITDGDNGVVFNENVSNKPSILARYSNYRDIDEDRYFEFGITATAGWNDQWDVNSALVDKSLLTKTFAFDLTLNDEPAGQMRYKNAEWRLEAYLLNKQILAADGSGEDSINSWGFFTSFQRKVSRITELGFRYDYYSPDTKTYDVSFFGSNATNVEDGQQWMISPYITWYKTPFVHYRMEFNHIDNGDISDNENRLMFQVVFAAGPHKHERY